MKKYITLFCVLILLAILFVFYNIQHTKANIIGSEWKLEFIADLDGSILQAPPGNKLSNKTYDMTLHFDKDSFVLTDSNNNQVWKGTYTSELVDKKYKTYKLNLSFNDTNTTGSGVLGTREYQNQTKTRTLTLVIKNKISSYIIETCQ